jgi:hypothetical protein
MVGNTVGFRAGTTSSVSVGTRIEYVTEGNLLTQLLKPGHLLLSVISCCLMAREKHTDRRSSTGWGVRCGSDILHAHEWLTTKCITFLGG